VVEVVEVTLLVVLEEVEDVEVEEIMEMVLEELLFKIRHMDMEMVIMEDKDLLKVVLMEVVEVVELAKSVLLVLPL
jgi:hypothetical protein